MFLFVSLVGVVCASEDSAMNGTTLMNTNDEMLSVSPDMADGGNLKITNDEELSAAHVVSGNTFNDIQTAINNAASGDIIYLGGKTFTSSGSIINVNKNVTIIGGTSDNPNGFSTLNGNGNNHAIFRLNASGIILTNIKFINGHHGNDQSAGAIEVLSSECTVANSTFDNCMGVNGGALRSTSSATSLKIDNCNFTDNNVEWSERGGAMYLEGTTEISNCNFNGNHAQNYGAVYSAGTVKVTNSNFTENYASNSNGGALFIGGSNSLVEDCNFMDNYLTQNHLSGGAIALTGSNSNIRNSNFERNWAGSGGAIYNTGQNNKIEGCNFTKNRADNSDNSGGAIYSTGSGLTVTDGFFEENHARNVGNDIYSSGANGLISDSRFTGKCDLSVSKENNALKCTLAVDLGDSIKGNAQLDNLYYWDGESKTPIDVSEGTKISLSNKNVTVEIYDNGNLYDTNTSLTNADGQVSYDYSSIPYGEYTYKAYYADDESVMKQGNLFETVSGNRFSDIQRAIDAASPGDVLYLKGITYTNDMANNIVINKPITLIGTDGTVLDAQGKSRIIYSYSNDPSVKVNLENITFKNGKNNDQGGAITVGDITLSVNGCHFENNTANQGKAVYTWGNHVHVSNSTFKQNSDFTVSGRDHQLVLSVESDYSNMIAGNALKDNLSYWDGSSYKTSDEFPDWPAVDLPNQNVALEIYDSNGQMVGERITGVTDENGEFVYEYSDLPVGDYTYKAYYLDADPDVVKQGKLYTIVEGNKFSDIQNAIDAATEGETLYLKDVTYTNDIGNMVIDKQVSIIGTEGTVLDAENKSRIFHIESTADNVVLENIEFRNGNESGNSQFPDQRNGGYGGAIYISPNANGGLIRNSTFVNNSASLGGGAVYNQHCEHWKVDNCTFIDNAAYGETNHVPFGGGAIWSCEAVTKITNSTFIDNKAPYGGALRGAFNIYDSTFDSNNATDGNGGAIDVATYAALAYGLKLEFANSTFTNNSANGDRGDFYDHGRAQGGAIHIFEIQEVDMYNCTCINNTADRGGAVDFYKMNVTNVDNCTFVNNTAYHEGGGLAIFCSDSTFKDSIISNNNAGTDGGAVWVTGDTCLFDNVTSENNTASRGGSSYVRGSYISVENSVFNNNSAIKNESADSGLGGALDIEGQKCHLINVSSSDNNASYGGSTFIRGHNTLVVNSTFTNNNATVNGGGLDVAGDNCNFENISISNCHAVEHGGGAYVEGDNNNFTNISSDYNSAQFGGALSIIGNDILVQNSSISHNNATNSGGGIYLEGEDCKFFYNNITYNNAVDPTGDSFTAGGGIAVSVLFGSYTNLTHNNISCNHATDTGGGVLIFNLGDGIYFEDIYAYNNTAENGGFAQLMLAYDLIVKNSTFVENHATGDIFGTIDRGEGGAFQISNAFHADIQANFYNNTAMNGSAIYAQDSVIHIHDSNFFDNQAHSYYLIAAPQNGTTYKVNDTKIVTFSHIGGDNIANAIHNRDGESYITLNNITFPFYHNGVEEIRTTPEGVDLVPVEGYENFNGTNIYLDDLENNQVIYYEVYNNKTGELIRNGSARTDINGTIDINLTDLGVGVYLIKAWYKETTYYTEITNETIIIVMEEIQPNMTVDKDSMNGTTILYVGDIVAFNITVYNTGSHVLGNVTVNEFYNHSELNYYDHSDKALWNKSGDVFTYLNDLGIGENATFTIWFVTLTNGTLVNNVTARSNMTNETNSSANVTVYKRISVNVTKIWEDDNNRDGIRPENVTVELFADGVKIKDATLNATNGWKYTFENLSTYRDNLTFINYTIREVPVAGYNVTITNNTAGNFTVTNSHIPLITSVNVTKVWEDDGNRDGIRPGSVVVELLANGTK